jgi:hypothetical protein
MAYETQPFKDFACNHCGWCCQRAPCALAIYVGVTTKGTCPYLRWNEQNQSLCGLMEIEKENGDTLKFQAASLLILSGEGCTHRWGPHPVSLMKELLQKGLVVGSKQYFDAKDSTVRELEEMVNCSMEPDSLEQAKVHFLLFCHQIENLVHLKMDGDKKGQHL